MKAAETTTQVVLRLVTDASLLAACILIKKKRGERMRTLLLRRKPLRIRVRSNYGSAFQSLPPLCSFDASNHGNCSQPSRHSASLQPHCLAALQPLAPPRLPSEAAVLSASASRPSSSRRSIGAYKLQNPNSLPSLGA